MFHVLNALLIANDNANLTAHEDFYHLQYPDN